MISRSTVIVRVVTAIMLVSSLTARAQDHGAAQQPKSGEDIYRDVCQACHMPAGEGAHSPTLKIPALAGNPTLGAASYPVFVVLNGKGAMPWFNGELTPAQIAAVTTYVRTHFGNNFPEPVTEQDVKQLATAPPTAEP